MLQVECESCKAPYQIDERRVPAAGLKMRCPKCGHSFLVRSPGAASPNASSLGRPMAVGDADPAASRASKRPTGVSAPKHTMIGLAPASDPSPARQARLPSDFPSVLGGVGEPPSGGSLGDADLPAIAADLPAAKSAAPPRPPMSPSARQAAPTLGPGRGHPAQTGHDLDLPAVASDLPAAKAPAPAASLRPAPLAPPRPTQPPQRRPPTIEIDLPVPAAGLPAPRTGGALADLPSVLGDLPAVVAPLPVIAADLPAAADHLPVIAAGLPALTEGLPIVAAGLPVTTGVLPVTAPSLPVPAPSLPVARSFGEVSLPSSEDVLAPSSEPEGHAPADPHSASFGGSVLGSYADSGAGPPESGAALHSPSPPVPPSPPSGEGAAQSFGEIELPREPTPVPPMPPGASLHPSQGPLFDPAAPSSGGPGDLQLEGRPRSRRTTSGSIPRMDAARISGGGGIGFGEVDFGGAAAGDAAAPEGAIPIDPNAGPVQTEAPAGPAVRAAVTAPVPQSFRPPAMPEQDSLIAPKRRSRAVGKVVGVGALLAAVIAGAALQLTPWGAFGYLAIGDVVSAGGYEQAARSAIATADKILAPDTYSAAKAAVDAVVEAHERTPRASSLTVYAALLDSVTVLRFGEDVGRAPRAKELLSELPAGQNTAYLDIAQAAQAAQGGDLQKARKGLEAAAGKYGADPVQRDLALLTGELALAAKDGAAAISAFKRALTVSGDARVHFGLARAYDLTGDLAGTKREVATTLVLSPMHAGALMLRARMSIDDADAYADLANVLDGPARAKASPREVSAAYAAKAWLALGRGSATQARDAFAQAAKLDPRNVEALNGEGRILLNEGRYTEALSRFDTALHFDLASPETIANDAEAKLLLERLADAKQQLVDAKARFPRSLPIFLLLGRVEQRLGDYSAAEASLRSAVSIVDPSQRDAVQPYVALSELLSERGRVADATAVLDEAKSKLPASSALERAFGEVSEAQGEHDKAIAHYEAAIGKDPKDATTHFRLAVTLRRIRKFDEASAQLDAVASVDKDYPGLSLERGLLFEESGDVGKAIEQFKSALAKAPADPDLQLRVGSAYVSIDRPDEALPMLHKVLDERPTSAEANHYIGRALMLKGRAEQADALHYLKRAVELDPNRAEFHVYVAWAANEAQPAQLDLANDEIDKALALDKLDPDAYWQKGVLERMEGAIEDAIKDEKHALEISPSRYEAYATLAECYSDKNDNAAAIAAWARAIGGERSAKGEGEALPHPYWHYQYGKLLLDRRGAAVALAQLLPAAQAAEGLDPRPGWLAPLEFLTADALRKTGHKAEAVDHYRRFLDWAPVSSPDRQDAKRALAQLTGGG